MFLSNTINTDIKNKYRYKKYIHIEIHTYIHINLQVRTYINIYIRTQKPTQTHTHIFSFGNKIFGSGSRVG